MTHSISALKRGQVGAKFAYALIGQALGRRHALRRTVEVTHRAQHQNSPQIDAAGLGEKFERLQRSRILHRRGGKFSLATGKVGHPLRCPRVKELPVPVGRGRKLVAHGYKGRALGGCAVEVAANLPEAIGVGQRGVASQVEGPLGQVAVERIDLAIQRSRRLLEGRCLAQRHIACRPAGWNLASVDLVGQVAIRHPAGPDRRTQ